MGTPLRCSTRRGDSEWAFAGAFSIVSVSARHPDPLLAMPHFSLSFSTCQWNPRTTVSQSKRPEIACSIDAAKHDPDYPGTCRHSQLAHNHPDECPDGIGANVHPLSNLLVRESLNQELDDFPFAFREAKRLAQLSSTL